MHYIAIFAMKRSDLSEYVISLAGHEEEARMAARNIMAVRSRGFVRCRVRPMDLKVAEVKAIVQEWGRLDGLAGNPPIDRRYPRIYALAYRRGHRTGTAEAQRAAGECEKKAGGDKQ